MEKFKFRDKNRVSQLPKEAGVYVFSAQGGPASGGKEKEGFLYIGKATNIRERVKNHFHQPSYRDNLFLSQVKKIGHIKTNSEIEALLLEAKLIKKYQPKFNIMWRDDKNYFWVEITPSFAMASAGKKEKCPRVFITHQPQQKLKTINYRPKTQNPKSKIQYIGPFVDGTSLKKTLRVLRRIFPYYTTKKHPKTLCPWCHLKLCPGPSPDLKEYKKNIKNLILVLKGKRISLLKKLKKEMKIASDAEDFEKAAKKRDQIFALERVISHAKVIEDDDKAKNWEQVQNTLKKIIKSRKTIFRIEGYDISNIQGKQATGSMVVFEQGLPKKENYRKFKIKTAREPNDVAMIKEVLERRLRHSEWPAPDIILIDGGKAQLNTTNLAIKQFSNLTIPVLALAKKNNELFIEDPPPHPPAHKATDGQSKNSDGQNRKPLLLKTLPREIFNLVLQIRDEAHRFARSYHHKLREIDIRKKI